MVLDEELRKQIEHVIIEQRQREHLKEHGFEPQRKLLLVGPPGTGKTMTARVLAGELGLPLFTIQIDGLITKFLGETAAKLRLIFDAIARARALYFFDEFDALGGERGARNDVAEIRRVLTSFLQFLEQDQSESLIVAATNHPNLLDRALFRRFDAVIEYVLPTPEVAVSVMRSRLSMFDTSEINWADVTAAAAGLSHADAVRCSDHAAKKAILERSTMINNTDLLKAVRVRHAMHGDITRKQSNG
jgi:SpoVK/Ycf46/Vps4 family AAA+-type ATPase